MTGSTAPGDRALAGRGGSRQRRPPAAPRRLRASATAAAEHALWQRILRSARVKVLPGKAFACPLPGWFRLCHATDAGTVATGSNLIRALETS
jgi:aspartate/methionine/tyrosine aminotransferase